MGPRRIRHYSYPGGYKVVVPIDAPYGTVPPRNIDDVPDAWKTREDPPSESRTRRR